MSDNSLGVYDDGDREVLESNQRVRLALIKKITSDGEKLPEDKADKVFVLGLLKDTDAQIFNKAKVKIAKNDSETAQDLAQATAEIIKRVQRPVRAPRPINEAQLVEPEGTKFRPPAPGETDIGLLPLTLDDIVEK